MLTQIYRRTNLPSRGGMELEEHYVCHCVVFIKLGDTAIRGHLIQGPSVVGTLLARTRETQREAVEGQ